MSAGRDESFVRMKRSPWYALLPVLFAPLRLDAVVTVFGPVPYQKTSDSPFYEGIQGGTLYLEDFEDALLNTPGVSIAGGFPARFPGVDGDDGVLDNRSNGLIWRTHGGSLPEYGDVWSTEIKFESSEEQGYPKYAGLVLPGFSTLSEGFDSYDLFRAYDGLGNDVTGDIRVKMVRLPPSTPSTSTLGNQFIGIYSDNGISKVLLAGTALDHLQYGYAIPEPGSALMLATAGSLVLLRRQRDRQ